MFIMFFMFIIVYPLWFWSKILKPGSMAAQAEDGWSLSMSLRLSCRYHHHSSRFQLNHFDKFVCHSWNKLFEVTDYLQCICAPLFFHGLLGYVGLKITQRFQFSADLGSSVIQTSVSLTYSCHDLNLDKGSITICIHLHMVHPFAYGHCRNCRPQQDCQDYIHWV